MSKENPDSRSKATRWLPPICILIVSALVALGIVVVEPFSAEVSAGGCSGALSSDYACHQQRYENLVLDSGVEIAFQEIKADYDKNDFVRSNCHQLVHVIGDAAAERYGDVAGAYARGDPFCSSGYYHGAASTFVAELRADKMLEEADDICADLGEHERYSAYHRNCAHGLGHGFMAVSKNELFESLRACDALADGWEREHCYGGVFMENIMAEDDPSNPSKYVRADRLLYPCTDVEDRYKTQCYLRQTAYALQKRDNDFAGVFGLCAEVEEGPRPACYQGLGRNAAVRSIRYSISETAETNSTGKLCTLGEDEEARSNCVVGAVGTFIRYYHGDARARALCESLEADVRAVCLRAGEEYYQGFQPAPE